MKKKKSIFKLTIKAKLILVMTLAVIALIGTTIFSYYQSTVLKSLQEESTFSAVDAQTATDTKYKLIELSNIVNNIMINGYSSYSSISYNDGKEALEAGIDQVLTLTETKGEIDFINSAYESIDTYSKIVEEELFSGLESGTLTSDDVSNIKIRLNGLESNYLTTMQSVIDSFNSDSQSATEEYTTASDSGTRFFFIVVGCIIIILFVLLYFFARSINKPITILIKVIKNYANLNFSNELKKEKTKINKRKDEIGEMGKELALMEENVRDFIISTSEASNQVASASQELTATAQQVSNGTEEVSDTIESMAQGANEQAEDTGLAAQNINDLGKMIEK